MAWLLLFSIGIFIAIIYVYQKFLLFKNTQFYAKLLISWVANIVLCDR